MVVLCLWYTGSGPALAQGDDPAVLSSDSPPQKAIEQWRALGFGMFIHWGPVSLTGHEIGWSRGSETSVETYDRLYKKFNPKKFDADRWAQIAKEAGMKYVVITTKHHDGFCMFPSDYTNYDIANTPYGRDVINQLARACRKRGIRFGTYYSACDWYHPDFPLGSPGGNTKKEGADLEEYVQYYRNQTKELVEKYDPFVIWYDVPQVIGPRHGKPTVKKLRNWSTEILINNRAYKGSKGDFTTPEQEIGSYSRTHPWETCMTITPSQWAWKPDARLKTKQTSIHNLLRAVGEDGNFLFNVGPLRMVESIHLRQSA